MAKPHSGGQGARENGRSPKQGNQAMRDRPRPPRNTYPNNLSRMNATEIANVISGLSGMQDIIPYYSGNNVSWINTQSTLNKIPSASKLHLPKENDYFEQLRWAKLYRDTSMLRGPLQRRSAFVVNGFKHRHADRQVVELFDQLAEDCQLKKKLKEIAWDLSTIGWVVVMPDSLNEYPKAVHLIHEGIINKRVFGYDNLYLQTNEALKEAIRENPENFPKYMVDAIKKGEGGTIYIKLQDVYLISAPRGTEQPYPRSPMFPLFEPLKVIENLVETQFAISFAIKQLMLHVKVSGGKDALGNERPANPKQLQIAAMQVRDGARVSTMVTPSTTELAFVSPDKDVFEAADAPYARAWERILMNIDIPMILVDGRADGMSYSTAVYVIKAFLQALIADRELLLDDFVYPWYKKIAERLYKSDKKKYAFLWDSKKERWNIPRVIFNETELKNVTEMLAIWKQKWSTGMYSGQTFMEDFQDDYDTEKKRKEEFNKDTSWVGLPFEPGMSMGIDGEYIDLPDNHPDAAPEPGTPAHQEMELQKDQIDHQRDQFEHQKDMDEHQKGLDKHQMQMDKENVKLQRDQIKQQKAQPPARPPGRKSKPSGAKPKAGPGRKTSPPKPRKKPAGKPGRPSKPDARPRSDSKNRNPRTSGASVEQANEQ